MSIILKIKELNTNWKFEYFVPLVYMLFGILGWEFNYLIGAIPIILFSTIMLFIFNDFKYAIPACLALLFSYNKGYVVEEFPFDIVIPVAIYALLVIIFSIKNFKSFKLKKIRSCIGMTIISIAFVIPIFWADLITKETSIYYVMYFSWLIYLLIFVFLVINLGNKSFKIILSSFTWLAVLLTFELAISVLRLHIEEPEKNILSFWFYIGWGLCNEAGIVLCFIIPFIFYEFIKTNNIWFACISLSKIAIAVIGIVLTTSRGSLLFGGVEILLLFVSLFFIKFNNKTNKICLLVLFGTIGLMLALIITKNKLIEDIFANIFDRDFDDNGRSEKWISGLECWLKSTKTVIFGSGVVSEIVTLNLFRGYAESFEVYHSTTLEILISSGIIGLTGLGIHFAEKYTQLKGKGLAFILIFGVGYLMVDLYGLIDNTYGMYYYMVPLVITMAAFNNNDNFELFDNKNNGLF